MQQRTVEPQTFWSGVDTDGAQLQMPIEIRDTFDRFDTSLGTLDRVEYAWDLGFGVAMEIAVTGGASGGVTGLFQVDGTTLSGDGGGNGNGASGPVTLHADYSLSGLLQVDPAVAAEAQYLPFLGTAGQSVDVVYAGQVSATSTGDALVTHELLDGSSVSLRYLYTVPEAGRAFSALVAAAALRASAKPVRSR